MFRRGQVVVVLGAYQDGGNECGTLVKVATDKEHRGKWWVDLGFTTIAIEPERLIDAEEFWKQNRAKIDSR